MFGLILRVICLSRGLTVIKVYGVVCNLTWFYSYSVSLTSMLLELNVQVIHLSIPRSEFCLALYNSKWIFSLYPSVHLFANCLYNHIKVLDMKEKKYSKYMYDLYFSRGMSLFHELLKKLC